MSPDPAPPSSQAPAGPSSVDDLLRPVRRIFAELVRKGDSSSVDAAIRQLTESAAEALRVERASFWRFSEERHALICTDLFQRTSGEHSSGATLRETSTPRYFAALASERSIAAHAARIDQRTSEFASDYLEPLGITSMLDAPVFVDGKLYGVVCHEHVGEPRTWAPWEELVAGTFADLAALIVNATARAEQRRALEEYHANLEKLVEDRTRELQQSEARFHALFDAAPVGLILSKLADDKVLAANSYAATLFGLSADEVIGTHAPDFWVDAADRRNLIERVRESGTVDSFEAQFRTREGKTFWADLAVRSLSVGDERALLFGIRDVTAHREAEEQLRVRATTDELTGALNRRRLFEIMEDEMKRAARYERSLSFAMLDLDHFKTINDRFGHVFGDETLRRVAVAVRGAVRRHDHVGRYGGEELGLLLPETSLDAAATVVERARAAIEDLELYHGDDRVRITVSAGVVMHRHGEVLNDLLRRADDALYQAKKTGRNRVIAV